MDREMKNAITENLPSMRLQQGEVRVGQVQRHHAGSCNGCVRGHYALDESENPVVTEVHLRGMSFRLCARCHELLKSLL